MVCVLLGILTSFFVGWTIFLGLTGEKAISVAACGCVATFIGLFTIAMLMVDITKEEKPDPPKVES